MSRTEQHRIRPLGGRSQRRHRSERDSGGSMSAPQAPVALITGGSRGIGLAIARRFLSDGYRVLVTGRDRESLAAAAAELGPRTAIEAGDVALRADVEHIAAAAASRY